MTSTVESASESATQLTDFGAAGLARLISSGKASSSEVVRAHIERVEKVNPKLNAVVVPLFEKATAAAEASDRRRAAGGSRGLLDGVPMTIKECYDVEGLATTTGLKHLASTLAPADAPIVAKFRREGAIFLGKTNVPHLLIFNEGDNPLYGRTNNPWDLERWPGGGSSGEGAIISAHGSPLGLATDYGGSIRIPPDYCGLLGFKPTSGRFTMRGTFDSRLFPFPRVQARRFVLAAQRRQLYTGLQPPRPPHGARRGDPGQAWRGVRPAAHPGHDRPHRALGGGGKRRASRRGAGDLAALQGGRGARSDAGARDAFQIATGLPNAASGLTTNRRKTTRWPRLS